jgi:hypothetical protein
MSGAGTFPQAFAELEPFAGWALSTETARNHKRIASTQAEIEAFADAMIPRLDAIATHLARYRLDDLPGPERRLFYMLLTVAEVAPCVEGYRAPTVPEGYDSRRFAAQEEFPLRPRA